jgi:PAS domain S-box-containing protein
MAKGRSTDPTEQTPASATRLHTAPDPQGAALLAAIVESSADAIFGCSLDGRVTSWNGGAAAAYGYRPDEIVGQPLSLLTGKDHEAEVSDAVARVSKGEHVDAFDTVRRHKDGTPIAVSVVISPVHDATGRIVGTSSVDRDTTDHERVRHELAETRAFLDNILQSSTKYSIIGTDLDRRILSWNEGARRNYGYAAGEILGTDSNVLHTPEDVAAGSVDALLAAALAEGLAEGTFERVRQDGSRFHANVVVTRRDDGAGRPLGYLFMSNDVSEQMQAEDRLRAASQYARSLIEASLDPLVTISAEGKITDVNEATIRVTGVERDRLVGTDFSDYFTEPEEARAGYEQVFAEGSVTDYPLTIRHTNGTLTDVLYNASVYRDSAGNQLGAFAAARDVTDRRRAEAELREQRARELERLAELERFQKLTVGRELRMIELKREIEELRALADRGAP